MSVHDQLGPVSAHVLVMARQASESAMHAEEAHFVFGKGKDAKVAPWTNTSAIMLRGSKSGGQLILGDRAEGVGGCHARLPTRGGGACQPRDDPTEPELSWGVRRGLTAAIGWGWARDSF